TLADNSQNLNNIVCKIAIFDPSGDTIKRTHLRVRNFTNSAGDYDGSYLEEFRFEAGDTNLEIQGSWGEAREWTSRGSWPGEETNKMDIQVYWYGNCDMWIDYIRVDNDVANDLFSTDPNNTRHQEYMEWLEWEGQDIAKYSAG